MLAIFIYWVVLLDVCKTFVLSNCNLFLVLSTQNFSIYELDAVEKRIHYIKPSFLFRMLHLTLNIWWDLIECRLIYIYEFWFYALFAVLRVAYWPDSMCWCTEQKRKKNVKNSCVKCVLFVELSAARASYWSQWIFNTNWKRLLGCRTKWNKKIYFILAERAMI